MLGRDHSALGLAAYAGGCWEGVHRFGLPHLTIPQMALGAIVAIGASLAPDIDEKGSYAGRDNPLSFLPIFGGHRQRTHWLATCVGVIALAYGIYVLGNDLAMAIMAGFCACTGASVLWKKLGILGKPGTVAFGVAVGWAAVHYHVHDGWWLVPAVGLAYLSHPLGDWPTPGGVPLLGPWVKHNFSLHLFKVGKAGEQIVVWPATHLLAGFAAWEAFEPTAWAWLAAHI